MILQWAEVSQKGGCPLDVLRFWCASLIYRSLDHNLPVFRNWKDWQELKHRTVCDNTKLMAANWKEKSPINHHLLPFFYFPPSSPSSWSHLLEWRMPSASCELALISSKKAPKVLRCQIDTCHKWDQVNATQFDLLHSITDVLRAGLDLPCIICSDRWEGCTELDYPAKMWKYTSRNFTFCQIWLKCIAVVVAQNVTGPTEPAAFTIEPLSQGSEYTWGKLNKSSFHFEMTLEIDSAGDFLKIDPFISWSSLSWFLIAVNMFAGIPVNVTARNPTVLSILSMKQLEYEDWQQHNHCRYFRWLYSVTDSRTLSLV